MKVLIVSDTHRQLGNLRTVLETEKPIDMLIHLGDVEGQEQQIREMADCHTEIIAGNNDFFSALEREKDIWIGRYRVLLTHGHYYKVSLGTELLASDAAARNFQIALFGHTHRPLVECANGVWIANPGSLSYPRQDGRRPSYLILDLDRRGQANFTIKYL